MNKRNAILTIATLLLISGWLAAPQLAVWSIALANKKGEESSRRARDRIVFFGERAIEPTIKSIEKHSPWLRRYCYLPSALEKIGGEAHSDLLTAIDEQDEPQKRVHLISALQSAFHDYSRLKTAMEDLEGCHLAKWGLIHMAFDVRDDFPGAPDFLTANQSLNPAFKAYWANKPAQTSSALIDQETEDK